MCIIQNDMMRYFREDLHRRLLSTDFKKQVDGLEMLQKVFAISLRYFSFVFSNALLYMNLLYLFQVLPSIGKEIVEVLDILLKWFVLQFCKSNTTCLLKVCNLLQLLSFFFSFSIGFLLFMFFLESLHYC